MNFFKTLAMVGLVGVGMMGNGICDVSKGSFHTDTNPSHRLPTELQSVRLTFSLKDAPPVEAFREFQKALWASHPGARLHVAFNDYLTGMLVKYAWEKAQVLEITHEFENAPIDEVLSRLCKLYNFTWRVVGDTVVLSPYTEA
jgi:hypothetical protein